MTTAFWTAALALGLLWPARVFSWFDGMPLDGAVEAIVVGVVVPLLWCFDRSLLRRTSVRALIVALIGLKGVSMLFVPDGLCARFSTTAPLRGEILTMPVDEPHGLLRSWDVRADWRAAEPRCTAIVDRDYAGETAFPAWFVNLLDQIRPDRRDISLALTGVVTAPSDGTLTLRLGEDMTARGRIGEHALESGSEVRVPLAAGTHDVNIDVHLTGERWRLVTLWDGQSAWDRGLFTVATPSGRIARAAVRLATTVVVALLLALWIWTAARAVNPGAPAWVWTAVATIAMVAVAGGRFERIGALLLTAAAFVPVAASRQQLRSAALMIAVPWIGGFVARALPLVGHFSVYSWDDWLAYQVAAGRIYMHGFWLEGGTLTFDYQPLYRWMNGALHLVFGDSSVGETYLDVACLVSGSLLAFELVRASGGFRAAMIACAVTLATFSLGTPWYFIGRGLSEIAAAGFAFATAFLLIRARAAGPRLAAFAGLTAALMFYTRLNHLLFAVALMALLLPPSTPMTIAALRHGIGGVRRSTAAWYACVFAAGVALFAARTWWYTGVFSVLYGTSLKNNDTGLRLTTIASGAAWQKVMHSLSALVWMNEPPHADPRSLLVALGVVAVIAAAGQLPRLRELPAAVVVIVIGSMLSSFLAHTHNYPGRMSIHLVPLAISAAIIAITRVGWRTRELVVSDYSNALPVAAR